MNILYCTDAIPPYSTGGPGKRIWSICKEFARRGHQITLVTTVPDKSKAGLTTESGVVVHALYSKYHPAFRPYVSVYNPLVIRRIRKIIRDRKPDVIHADNIHQNVSYGILGVARSFGIPAFITARDAMMVAYGKIYPKVHDCTGNDYRITWHDRMRQAGKSFNPFREYAIRHYVRQANKVFTNSLFLKEILHQNGIENTEVVHNGVEVATHEFSPDVLEEKRNAFGFADKKIIFLPGRLNYAKGAYALVDALTKVIKKQPRAVALFAGATEEEKKNVLAYAREQGVVDFVRIFGWTDGKDLEAFYALSDVVTSPSLCVDFFPGVNLEAASYKKPVLTTCFGGGKEFVQDGKTGYVINPYDTSEFADRISKLLEDSRGAQQMGEAGFLRLREHFSLSEQAEKLLRWYRKESHAL